MAESHKITWNGPARPAHALTHALGEECIAERDESVLEQPFRDLRHRQAVMPAYADDFSAGRQITCRRRVIGIHAHLRREAVGPYLCFHCVLCFVFYVFWPSWAESVFCVLSFSSLERSLCFVFTCFGPRSGANCLILK